jgi:hypothetical protein
MQYVACRTGGTGPQGRESPIEQENRMRTHPKTPKLLPWLAKKAGISERRATTLWLESERWAARRAASGSSAYYKLAVDRLLELTAAESLREDAARVWAVSMQVAQQGAALTARGWRLIGSTARQHQLS